ncbi:MAG: CDP-glucose 4,6-dehydratase [Lutibacter sp.]
MELNNKLKDFYKGKTVLVTGATGFKGSWLAYWLYEMGANVIGYSLAPLNEDDHFNLLKLNEKIKHIEANILDVDKLKEVFNHYKPEVVFHLAAQALVRYSYDKPKLTFDTNVAGSVNVLEAIRATTSVKSVIYVTSDKAYKNKEWEWGYRENDELGGHDPYSASKAAAEIIFSSYMDSFFSKNEKIGVGTVRAGNVIGGGDWALDRIIPDCIKALSKGNPIVIRNPHATRPWQHVLEPLSGYLLLAVQLYNEPKKYSGAWNFGPNIKSIRTVKVLSEKVISVFGKGEIDIQFDTNANHEASILHLNCDKSNMKLNWYPTWDFDDTIECTVNWYLGHMKGENPLVLTQTDIKKFLK